MMKGNMACNIMADELYDEQYNICMQGMKMTWNALKPPL